VQAGAHAGLCQLRSHPGADHPHLPPSPAHTACLQAKDAMQHPYFNDFPDREIGERHGFA